MTDFTLAVGIPLLLTVAYLVSARWWAPRMSRLMGRVSSLPVRTPWVFGVFSAVYVVLGVVGSALGREDLSTFFALGMGVAYGLFAARWSVAHRGKRGSERFN